MLRHALSPIARVTTGLLLLAAVGSGCADPPPDPRSRLAVNEREFEIPPRRMLEIVKQTVMQPPLSLPVESEEKGSIVTGWERHRGDFHIARHWQERTRYRVTVIPGWDNPNQQSRLQVVQETQQRKAEGQEWDPAPGLPRSHRAQKLLDRIAAAATGAASGRDTP